MTCAKLHTDFYLATLSSKNALIIPDNHTSILHWDFNEEEQLCPSLIILELPSPKNMKYCQLRELDEGFWLAPKTYTFCWASMPSSADL